MLSLYTVDDQTMIALFNEYVFFEHLKKLHLIRTVQEEIGSVNDLPCIQLNCHYGHHQNIAAGEVIHCLGNQENSLPRMTVLCNADPTRISWIFSSQMEYRKE